MRVTVLGGAAAGPNAGSGCSGYLVTDADTAIVLDLGAGTLPELKRHYNPALLDGIVISHQHLDHILDLVALRCSLKYSPVPATSQIPVWLPEGAGETLFHLARAFTGEAEAATYYDGIFDLRVYNPRQTLTLGSLTIEFVPTVHSMTAWAMRVRSSAGGGELGYTADTGPSASLQEALHGVSVLIAEAGADPHQLEPEAERGHLTATEAGALAARCGAKRLVLSHLWEELGFDHQREEASRAFGGRIELAKPGLMVDV